MKFPISYKNGNYNVTILNDGTKIRVTDENDFIPSRPETLDINISNYCENNCEYCYLNATIKGKHGNLNHDFLNTIPEFTEVAINYARHPGLFEFLKRMKEQNIIVNITINEIDLVKDWKDILYYQQNKLVYGIGVSLCIKDENTKWIVQNFDNVVAHTIFGITTLEDYYWISESFDKVLVLGYKRKGRGRNIIPGNVFGIEEIYDLFKIVSFDNLGIEQTNIKEKVSEQEWEQSFMGEEGTASFFIDTVEEKFYKSSLDEDGEDINNLSVIEMFNNIKNKKEIVL